MKNCLNMIFMIYLEHIPLINEVVYLINALFSKKDIISDETNGTSSEKELETDEFEEKIQSSYLNHIKMKKEF